MVPRGSPITQPRPTDWANWRGFVLPGGLLAWWSRSSQAKRPYLDSSLGLWFASAGQQGETARPHAGGSRLRGRGSAALTASPQAAPSASTHVALPDGADLRAGPGSGLASPPVQRRLRRFGQLPASRRGLRAAGPPWRGAWRAPAFAVLPVESCGGPRRVSGGLRPPECLLSALAPTPQHLGARRSWR